ncbi:site-specific DNA-methyltransferase [Priestia koreensis]|uniref:site-specific DNA-methyltransferase n=1 Tax=Priestia koreensis TaxID=284581 RepID=UPI00203A6E0D|nr:site-specific DNA-methyltransferase [Priestia koreensis]MCM3006737.1 site-specific DNA-methyltransferase [Priestia koreensis]
MREKIEKNENLDILSDKLELLKSHFPQCFTREGQLDFKKLEAELSQEIDIVKEGFSLNWLGKSYAKVIANLETETVISPDETHNSLDGNKDSQNVYIKGDNLDVLKHLVNAYTEKVKMIYIDPPYNTGSDNFAYQDNFNFTPNQLANLADVDIEEAVRILEFTDRNSSSHSAWLTFMYPRLFIARELLSDDGLIFISIDDNEVSQLKLLCDEVFGEENFVAQIAWEKRFTRNNDAKLFSTVIDYVVIYRKSDALFKLREPRNEKNNSIYKNPDNDSRGSWTSVSFVSQRTKNERPNLSYDIKNPISGETITHPVNAWKYSEKVFKELESDNRLYWGANGENKYPRLKRFLSELDEDGVVPINLWNYKETGTIDDGTKVVDRLIGKDVFEYPKPVSLILRMIKLAVKQNDIIMDFFSGSATTAHAVLQANSEDNGNRKFLCVQLPEVTKEKSVARNLGYKDITQIGIERIKKASTEIKEETKAEIDYGFKVFETKAISDEVSENDLSKMLTFNGILVSDNTILNQFGKETVLTTWMLEDGYPLTVNYEEIDLGIGYIAYRAENTLYLLDGEFTIEENLKSLIEKVEKEAKEFIINKIVLFGYSFSTEIIASLQDNMKHLRNGRSSADIHVEVRY